MKAKCYNDDIWEVVAFSKDFEDVRRYDDSGACCDVVDSNDREGLLEDTLENTTWLALFHEEYGHAVFPECPSGAEIIKEKKES